MRITFVIASADMSGGVRVIATHAKRLQELGHEVLVVGPTGGATWNQRFRDLVRGRPMQPVRRPNHLNIMGVPYKALGPGHVARAADVPAADVIVATWWETAEWVSRFPASKGAKAYFVQGHEVCVPGQPADRVNATWRLPFHKIAVSRWLVDLLRESGDDDVSLALNSVDPSQFCAPPRERNQRPTVGFVYSTAPFKGCDVAISTITRLAETFPDLRVIAFGAEPVVADLSLPDFVEFTEKPPQSQIRELYSQCDVLLCASRAEGFYLPALEAMACRCPVVSTRVGALFDLIEEGHNGFLCDVEDSECLAERLETVLSLSPEGWKRMSDAALETALGYTWNDATDAFYDGIERAIAKSKKD